jgi:signal-transduction protein with cAMP-binding, CBS, and nucleotidyltransferase domain
MNTSVIRYRVADFLKRHAPFDALPEPDLLDLAASGRVKFHESEEFVMDQGRPAGPHVWVIQQGRVDLLDGDRLRDVLGEGDLIGVERLLGHTSWLYSARTANDVILYSIDARRLEDLAARFPALQAHLAAHVSVADAGHSGRRSWLDAAPPPVEFLRARSHAAPPAAATVPAGSTRSYVRAMVTSRSEAVVIHIPAGPAVLTAADLSLFCDRNPALLLREIRTAANEAVLAPLVAQGTRMVLDGLVRFPDVDDCSMLAAELVAAAAEPVIRFAERDVLDAGLERPAVRHCWMAFGALARAEEARPELPAIGVVFDDAAPQAAAWFASAAGQMAAGFHACGLNGPGFDWPAGAHPCLPLSEWKRFYAETIRDPLRHSLYTRRELFDIRPLRGDASLVRELHAEIDSELSRHGLMLPLLANDTLAHLPPLAFFRGLVVNADGAESDAFDAERIALQPIAGAARVFALARRGSACAGTLDRLAAAAHDFPDAAPVFRDAAQAFRIAFFHLAASGTPLVEPSRLSRYDQRLLTTAFAGILRLLEFTAASFE